SLYGFLSLEVSWQCFSQKRTKNGINFGQFFLSASLWCMGWRPFGRMFREIKRQRMVSILSQKGRVFGCPGPKDKKKPSTRGFLGEGLEMSV
ncbi:MAG: hypothetical protein LBE27_05650, partial [Deltaproteobacteria bacterium]|nr:hypothetical protein [Deltaproteobacteria bacterium]